MLVQCTVNVAECLRKFLEKEGDNPRIQTFCSTAKDLGKTGAHNYESGGQEFESLRARHCGTKLDTPKAAVFAPEAATSVRSSTLFEISTLDDICWIWSKRASSTSIDASLYRLAVVPVHLVQQLDRNVA